MADRRTIKAVGLADKLEIPIIYAKDQKDPLHIRERLKLESDKEVTPVMNFHRHDEGTTYRLQLRIDGNLVENLSEHHPIVLTHEPGLFVLDKCIYALGEGFSGQLLLPFESRRELLRRLIAPYFLKHTKEEVLSDLPERQDEVVVCTMTDEQTRQYTEELSKARNEWLDPTASSQGRQIHILAALQRLRQIANGERKLGVVFDHLENLRQTQHKVLIFSEYVSPSCQPVRSKSRFSPCKTASSR